MFVYRSMSIQHSDGSIKLSRGTEEVDPTAISAKFGPKECREDMQDR
jgi:hypothetical protein